MAGPHGVLAAAFASLVLLGGCGLRMGPPAPIEDTRLVSVSPQQALDRAGRWLRGQGFVIDKVLRHRGGGRLVAVKAPFDEGGYARCAWAFAMSGGVKPAADVTVTATSERAGRTQVRAAVDIALVNGYGDRAECASRGKLEQEILAAVAR